MADTFTPATQDEVRDVVAWAAAESEPLEIVGHGSKRTLGKPVQAAHVLDLAKLSGVTAYEPAELVITAKAGTPVAQVETLLGESNQELAFEPMDYGPLLGQPEGRGTLGGLLATNLAGPKRLKHGAARDHVLGIHAVSGRGEVFKSGGTVVKNVTGYDLSRGLAGSWGTLAVTTSLSLKVLPRAETEATALVEGLEEAQAIACLCRAMGSSTEVSAAAHLPAGMPGRLGIDGVAGGKAATILRLEGFAPSVDYRFEALGALLKPLGRLTRIERDASRSLWRAIRDVRPFCQGAMPVWRVSVPPASGAAFAHAVRAQCDVELFHDWSGGLVWVHTMDGKAHDVAIRRAVAENGGGHATLVRADAGLRAAVDVFQPQPFALAALSRRLKAQFDPNGILNPGRMMAGA